MKMNFKQDNFIIDKKYSQIPAAIVYNGSLELARSLLIIATLESKFFIFF